MSKQRLSCSVLFLLICSGPALAGNLACSASSGPMRNSLLELYTSEGCSSCPPADLWLSGLRAQPRTLQRLVPLAFHVDYWDRLGWSDRFSKAAYSARQRWIAKVNQARTLYTPQFVLDGRDWRPQRRELPESGGDNRAGGELRLNLRPLADGRLEVSGEARLLAPADNIQVFLALYENKLTSHVATGENAGRVLRHDFVVRDFVGLARLPASGRLDLHHVFALESDWKRADLGVSAFIQNVQTGEVYQVLQRPACSA